MAMMMMMIHIKRWRYGRQKDLIWMLIVDDRKRVLRRHSGDRIILERK